MHVLMIPAWYDDSGATPTGIFVLQQAHAVSSVGVRAGLIFVEGSNTTSETSRMDGEVYIMTRSTWLPPKVSILKQQWYRHYSELFELYVRKNGMPDLLHAHSYMAGDVARYLSKRFKLPFMLTEHASGVINGVPVRHKSVVRVALKEASIVIAVSDAMRKGILQYTERTDIKVIPNPVDTDMFQCTHRKSPTDPFTYLYVGWLNENKNVNLILEALAIARSKSHNVRLSIVGDGTLRKGLQQKAAALGITDVVHFYGNLPHEQVAKQMCSSEVLISASEVETFGVSAVEAMSAGIPVISTPNGGVPLLLNKSLGVVTPDFSPSSLADAMSDVVQHYERYNAEIIRQHAIDNFGMQSVGNRLKAIYQNA